MYVTDFHTYNVCTRYSLAHSVYTYIECLRVPDGRLSSTISSSDVHYHIRLGIYNLHVRGVVRGNPEIPGGFPYTVIASHMTSCISCIPHRVMSPSVHGEVADMIISLYP